MPTEFEWEAAASWDPASGEARAYPWGNATADSQLANIDQLTNEQVERLMADALEENEQH